MARKEMFVGDGMGKREAANIELLRTSITKHDHILPIYAVYTYKDTLNIISELADDDLEVFLTGDHYDAIFSAPQCLAKLLSETCNLAHALAFLHERLRETDKNHILCHMDFHTRNILVKDTAKDFKFVISDFGLSKVQRDPRDRQTPLNLQEVTKTNARRRPGTFLAPEVRTGSPSPVGRKSDVWSLACIVIRILTRGVLGREVLNEFDQCRVDASKNKSKDYFYSRTLEGDCVINEAVEIWLSSLFSKSGPFVRNFVSELRPGSDDDVTAILENLSITLRDALSVAEERRIDASEFSSRLDRIREQVAQLRPKTRYVLGDSYRHKLCYIET